MTFSPFDDAHPRYTPTSMFGQTRKHVVTGRATVKDGKGVLLGWSLHNSSYAEQSIIFHDAVDWKLILGPGESRDAEFTMGVPFYGGITYEQSLLPAAITGILLFA